MKRSLIAASLMLATFVVYGQQALPAPTAGERQYAELLKEANGRVVAVLSALEDTQKQLADAKKAADACKPKDEPKK